MSEQPKVTNTTYRNLRLATMVAALLMVSLLVIGPSRAAFSGSTGNTGNAFGAGSVTIDDDDGGSALFDVSAMAPGDTHENCIEVSYSGTLPAEVRIYGAAGASSDLNDALTVTIERGTGGSFVGTETPSGSLSCTGFVGTQVFSDTMTQFLAANNYANGEDSWSVTNGSSAVYRFFVEFNTNDNSLQGGTSNVTFTWEAQNT